MKKLISVLIVIIMMLSLTTISMAAEVSVSLDTLKEPAMRGKETKIILTVNNFTREGTQKAIEAKVEYDDTKLEYKSINWLNNWTGNVSTDRTGLTANKASEVKESEVIAEITYLIKEEAEIGKTEIKASQILTSADGDEVEASDVKAEIEITEIGTEDEEQTPPEGTEVKLESIEITNKPNKTEYKVGEKFDKTGMTVMASYSDGRVEDVENYTYSPAGKLGKDDKEIIISYTEEGVTKTAKIEITVKEEAGKEDEPGAEKPGTEKPKGDKDGTVADKDMPDTGIETIAVPAIIIAIMGIVGYVGYRKNNI